MAARKRKESCDIADDVVDVLADLQIAGQVALRYKEQLDRARYLHLNAVLEGLGGRWDRRASGHVFPAGVDVRGRIEAALLTGTFDDPRAGDFFETPTDLGWHMVAELADILPSHDVLEPSAGVGALLFLALKAGAKSYTAIESNIDRCNAIHAQAGRLPHRPPLTVWHQDFLAVPTAGPTAFRCDRVVMNPPFSGQQDIDHVVHAHRMLRPDGLLVGVMSAGVRFRTNRKAEGFRALVRSVGGSIDDLPEGSFLSSGTGVRTVMVTMPSGEL